VVGSTSDVLRKQEKGQKCVNKRNADTGIHLTLYTFFKSGMHYHVVVRRKQEQSPLYFRLVLASSRSLTTMPTITEQSDFRGYIVSGMTYFFRNGLLLQSAAHFGAEMSIKLPTPAPHIEAPTKKEMFTISYLRNAKPPKHALQ